jgi:ferredoxin
MSEGQPRLRVNPIACQAHGLCIELLPELIGADPWGYPIIAQGPVPDQLLPLARRAVAACPTLALLLAAEPGQADAASPTARRARRPPAAR